MKLNHAAVPGAKKMKTAASSPLNQFLCEVRTAYADAIRITEARLSELTVAQKRIHAKHVKKDVLWREDIYKNASFLRCLNGFLCEHKNSRKAAIKAAINLIIKIEFLLISFKPVCGLSDISSHTWAAKQNEVIALKREILKLCKRKDEDINNHDVAQALAVLVAPIDIYTHLPKMFDEANRPKAGGKSRNINSTWRGWKVRELSGNVSHKTDSRDAAIAGLLSFMDPDEKWTGDQVNKFLLSRKKNKTTKSALDLMK